jgi:hypothetical protein
MSTLLLALLVLIQADGCDTAPAREAAHAAAERVAWFDLSGAADHYGVAAAAGCRDAGIAEAYLRGLQAARAAYREGGSEASLAPVQDAMRRLADAAAAGSTPARIGGFVLEAASAAAQSERDVMALVLEHALAIEAVQLQAGESGAPIVTAHEVAGDLWLQVHRYEEARDAYETAAEQIGRTPFVILGLARTAARMKDGERACREYQALLAWWGESRSAETSEIVEARTFLSGRQCGDQGEEAGGSR